MFVNGCFSVRRSRRNFCWVAGDMALEQTINAEAKNRLKGIIAFADINSAVNRWLVTSSMRVQIVNQVLDIADMNPNTDTIHQELKTYRIDKDSTDLISLTNSIADTLNPSQSGINRNALCNIKTGKKVSRDAENYMLSVIDEGKEKREIFINECNTVADLKSL